jgi:hypothetical protein
LLDVAFLMLEGKRGKGGRQTLCYNYTDFHLLSLAVSSHLQSYKELLLDSEEMEFWVWIWVGEGCYIAEERLHGEWGCPMKGSGGRLSATSPTLNLLGKWDVDHPAF